MATIGTITVEFSADLLGLREGIAESLDLFEELSDKIDDLSEQIEEMSSASVKITAELDKSAVSKAKKGIEDATKDATVTVSADTGEAEQSVSRLSSIIGTLRGAFGALPGITAGAAEETFRFADNASTAAVAGETLAEAMRRQADAALLGATGQSADAAKAYAASAANAAASTGAVSEAVSSSASALRGFSDAANTATSSDASFLSVIDKTITAVGRGRAAFVAGGTALGALTGAMGGSSVVSAALGGNAAAAATAVSSLSGAVVGGVASFATYSAIMGLTRLATSGLSDESRAYVEQVASVGATAISAAVGVRASAAAFRYVVTGINASSTASEFFSRAFSGLSSTVTAASSRLSGLTAVASRLYPAIRLVTAAANEKITLTQFAALSARIVATGAAFGAASGALSAYAAGTSLAAGAAAGATSAVTGFVAAIPAVAPLAIAAAVATGRFSHELEQMSLQAQAIDQMASRFGASYEEITKLRLAAANTNVSMSQLAKGQQNFYTSLSKIKAGQLNVENVREAKLAYDKLKISVEELKSLKPEEAFKLVAKRLSEVKDPADRTAIAFDLFGKQGAAILPALKEFGELEDDFKRLGGALSKVNFDRFLSLETSFDRLKASSSSLGQVLLVPFLELQKAFNNATADIKGGLSAAFAPVMTILTDMTKPLSVTIEVIGRVINMMLRLVGAILKIAGAATAFSTIANLAEMAKDVIFDLFGYIEAVIGTVESAAAAIDRAMRPVAETFKMVGEAVVDLIELFAGNIFGDAESGARNTAVAVIALAAAYATATFSTEIFNIAMKSTAVQAVVSAVATAAAWVAAIAVAIIPTILAGIVVIGAYAAATIAAAAATAASAVVMGISWLIALGPIGLIILGIAGIVAGLAVLYAFGGSIVSFFTEFSDGTEKINAATASVEELAAAAEKNAKSGFQSDLEALADNGVSAAQEVADSLKSAGRNEIAQSVSAARGRMDELTISAARFGQAGADAAAASQKQFTALQQSLADGNITLDEFDTEAARLGADLEKNLSLLRDDSPEATLKKNLELYKQLDDAAKSASKSVRDINAGTVIEDKFFPTSEEIKSRAAEYKAEYIKSLEEIKKKQQSGVFAAEIKQKKQQNEADFNAGRISREQFETVKIELDATSAQDQASIAAEEAKREFDRKMKMKVELDMSFADSIRKSLDEAFLSPVDKFNKQLQKIRDNKSLTESEKTMAEAELRSKTRESLVGKSAQAQMQERRRDVTQAAESGLIGEDRLRAELQKASEDFAKAVGVTKTPFEEFSSSLNGIAAQFGFAGQPLDVVRDKLKGNAEQLALFDRALQESRDALLRSLGVEKTPEQVFQDQMKKIAEAANATDPNKRITAEQAEQARSVAIRKRDESLGGTVGIGADIAERRRQIVEAYGGGKDDNKLATAMNKLDIDKRQAAGLEATPTQALRAGVDKVNDAFGVTGKSLDEIHASLQPGEFEEYAKALKKNGDAVRRSVGVEETGAQKFSEARQKLTDAFEAGVISEKERDRALKDARDKMLSSLGISKTPAAEFEEVISRINESASELTPDEFKKGMKDAKDKLLSSLGIENPSKQAADAMARLREALDKGQISTREFALGSRKARDTLLESLGIPISPVAQLRQRFNDLSAALAEGQITQQEFKKGQEEARRSMLPGSDEESPVKKFEREMSQIDDAISEGLIDPNEAASRRLNLQAQLQEDLKPSLDMMAADRRGVEASDARSKGGVDTFFRILRGNDNPSLKAQLEVAKNTKIIAEAARSPKAAPVVAQLSVR